MTINELRASVAAGHHKFGILLAGGRAVSRKTIRLRGGKWHIKNHIDNTSQALTDAELWTESNIGEALEVKDALIRGKL
jgi:hypothetical protein